MITLQQLMKRDKGICHICTKPVLRMSDASRDHLIPRSLGGSNANRNIALAHKWCNKDKGHKIFRAEQHGTGYVIVDPKGDIVSDNYPSFIDAHAVATEMNADRLYMDEHYETAKELAEGDISDIIVLRRVQNHPV